MDTPRIYFLTVSGTKVSPTFFPPPGPQLVHLVRLLPLDGQGHRGATGVDVHSIHNATEEGITVYG